MQANQLEPTELVTQVKILFQDMENHGLNSDAATVKIVTTPLGMLLKVITLDQER